jgi:hypothetical protein
MAMAAGSPGIADANEHHLPPACMLSMLSTCFLPQRRRASALCRRLPGKPKLDPAEYNFRELLRKAWADKIEFEHLNIPNPAKIPAGPVIVVDDDIEFHCQV